MTVASTRASFMPALITAFISIAVIIGFKLLTTGFPEELLSLPLLYSLVCYASAPITVLIALNHLESKGSVWMTIFNLTIACYFTFLTALLSFVPILVMLMKGSYFFAKISFWNIAASFFLTVLFVIFPILLIHDSTSKLSRKVLREGDEGAGSIPLAYVFVTSSASHVLMRMVNIVGVHRLFNLRIVNYYPLCLFPTISVLIIGWVGMIKCVIASRKGYAWIPLAAIAMCASMLAAEYSC